MKSEREMTPFGRRMRLARREAGLTQPQAAEKVGCGQSNVAGLESNGQGTSLVAKFAEVYGVRVQWLAEGVGQMREPAGTAPPPNPPPRYSDRHEVDPSDWALLQAAKDVLTSEEQAELLRKAEHFKRRMRERLEAISARGNSMFGEGDIDTPISSPADSKEQNQK